MTPRLPDKTSYRRAEVEVITRLAGRVLDYWEDEFDAIRPDLNSSGEKIYSRRDVETLLNIKEWLILERVDKQEVRRRLAEDMAGKGKPKAKQSSGKNREKLIGEARSVLADILTILQKDDTN